MYNDINQDTLTNTLLFYLTLDYINQNYVDINFFSMDISSFNNKDIILQNNVNRLSSRILDNYDFFIFIPI